MDGRARRHQLAGGLTLINAPLPHTDAVTLELVIRRGSRDETPDESAYAELVARLFFTASQDDKSTDDLLTRIESLGAETDVEVEPTSMTFAIKGQRDSLPELVEILTALVTKPGLRDEDVAAAKQATLDSLAAETRNQAAWTESHVAEAAYRAGSPLARAAAPDRDVIARADASSLRRFRERVFDPRDMALVVAGGAEVAPAELTRLAAALRSTRRRPHLASPWRDSSQPWLYRTFVQSGEPSENIILTIPGLRSSDPDRAAFAVFYQVLSGSMSGRLMTNVRGPGGLVYFVYAKPVLHDDGGRLDFVTGAQPGTAEQTVAAIIDQLRDLAGEGTGPTVTAEELETARDAVTRSMYASLETDDNLADRYAAKFAERRPLRTPDQDVAAIAAVTAADVTRVARRLTANLDQLRLVAAGPRDHGGDLHRAALGGRDVAQELTA